MEVKVWEHTWISIEFLTMWLVEKIGKNAFKAENILNKKSLMDFLCSMVGKNASLGIP
jgi:hypothetical protein